MTSTLWAAASIAAADLNVGLLADSHIWVLSEIQSAIVPLISALLRPQLQSVHRHQ